VHSGKSDPGWECISLVRLQSYCRADSTRTKTARFQSQLLRKWGSPMKLPTMRGLSLSTDRTNRRWSVVLPQTSAPPGQRLVSVDALRGFTMFWIIGGRELVIALVGCVDASWADAVAGQLTHPSWEGFVAWDVIMPVFLFLVGVSMPFAFGRRVEVGESAGQMYRRIARRVVVLWVLGMIAQGSLLKYHFHELEFYSNTLQAIAVGYLVTSLALMHLSVKGQLGLFAALVVGYWMLLEFVPFNGNPAGTLKQIANLALSVDQTVLGDFRRQHSFTWIVTSLGFAATVLLGALAGHVLRDSSSAGKKLLLLTLAGIGLASAGWIWSYSFPLNRHLWTSSMILWTGGLSFVLLAVFYGVIDVWGAKSWAFPFVVIGANALLAYVFDQVFDRSVSDTLIRNLAIQLPVPYDELLRSLGEVGLLWLILWYLYRNRTFLRA
jgi:predicted acyltransferase